MPWKKLGTAARAPLPQHAHRSKQRFQKLLREADHLWTQSSQVDWSPKTLQDLLRNTLPDAEIIAVSNREPYIHNRSPNGIVVQTAGERLGVGAGTDHARVWRRLDRARQRQRRPGNGRQTRPHPRAPEASPAYTLRRVWITEEEQDGYYYGFANEGLWPLCHIAFVRPIVPRGGLACTIRAINRALRRRRRRRGAHGRSRSCSCRTTTSRWLPQMIRERLPKATIVTVLAHSLAECRDIQHLPVAAGAHRRAARQHDHRISHAVSLQQLPGDASIGSSRAGSIARHGR